MKTRSENTFRLDPAIVSTVVVLPAPFGPIMVTDIALIDPECEVPDDLEVPVKDIEA